MGIGCGIIFTIILFPVLGMLGLGTCGVGLLSCGATRNASNQAKSTPPIPPPTTHAEQEWMKYHTANWDRINRFEGAALYGFELKRKPDAKILEFLVHPTLLHKDDQCPDYITTLKGHDMVIFKVTRGHFTDNLQAIQYDRRLCDRCAKTSDAPK
jgi:hypothetical protein